MSDQVRFVTAPLVALVVFGAAVVIRFRSGDGSESHDARVTTTGSALRGVVNCAAIGLVAGHLLTIMWPNQLLSLTRDLRRLIVFEAAFFVCGAVALLRAVAAVRRRTRAIAGSDESVVESMFAWLLLLTIGSGMYTAIAHRWASVWSLVTVTRYGRSLLTLQPDIAPLESAPFAMRIHILASFVVFGLVGVTVHVDGVLRLARRVWRAAFGRVATLVNREWRVLHAWTIRSSRSLLWPDEDED